MQFVPRHTLIVGKCYIDSKYNGPRGIDYQPDVQIIESKTIQQYLGHTQLETTMVYLHLTQTGQENACLLINSIMGGLEHGYH